VTDGPLAGRTAVVTGAGQGVGRGIALALAARGANVVIAARRAETGEPVAEEIRGRGDEATCIVTDVTSRDAVAACVDATVERYGGLEIMVHNAYQGSTPHRVEGLDLDLWRTNSRTAVWGSYYCAQLAFPHLRTAGRRGRLILLTSPAGVEGSVNIPAYAPVNCIAPVAETPALSVAFDTNPVLRERVEQRTSLRRIGDAELDIGGVAAFLAGDDGAYVTGQTVVCDGGSFMGL
jgi:NAD(P)-dependent dehydrogenase (short-subunit alcohol dehydrogenase family)